MFKLNHLWLATLNGFIWLSVGIGLGGVGLNFIVTSILQQNLNHLHRPILDPLSSLAGGMDQAALFLIGFCLLVGFAKGHFVLRKAVERGVNHIRSLPNPASISQLYAKKYYLLLGVMVLLGVGLRFTALDIRGAVDLAVGTALIRGACSYFNAARRLENA